MINSLTVKAPNRLSQLEAALKPLRVEIIKPGQPDPDGKYELSAGSEQGR